MLLAQNGLGEFITGDTHQYGMTFDPFDSERASELVLAYLDSFARLPERRIVERWHGVYPGLDGQSEIVATPEAGATLVQVTNGLGMTMSFGLAEEILDDLV
ncbi:MAG TPA: hypothetical protein VMT46_16200 [Anaerolineaceae bacterium]|nr:hypothetical protein [Anaerolineaceae bacterium]